MNRRTFALAGLALTPVIATTPGRVSAAAARRQRPKTSRQPKPRPRNKIVTRTFQNPQWISVPGTGTSGLAYPYPTIIDVHGFNQGRLVDVNLTLKGFTHGYPADVDIMLAAPNGKAAIVMSDAGERFSVTDLTITLDDQAPALLPDEARLTSGTYKPTNHFEDEPEDFPGPAPSGVTASGLVTFKGVNPNGTWRLFVVDDSPIDSGMITGGWSLTIKARVPARRRPSRR